MYLKIEKRLEQVVLVTREMLEETCSEKYQLWKGGCCGQLCLVCAHILKKEFGIESKMLTGDLVIQGETIHHVLLLANHRIFDVSIKPILSTPYKEADAIWIGQDEYIVNGFLNPVDLKTDREFFTNMTIQEFLFRMEDRLQDSE